MATNANAVVVYQPGKLLNPLGTYGEFISADHFYAEALTFEDGEGNDFEYVETNEGLFQVVPESEGNVLNVVDVHHEGIEEGLGGPFSNRMWVLSYERDMDREEIITNANKLRNLNVALVYSDEKVGLTLTGGGMDLSWQVAAAHMRLGYYPPTDVGSHNLEYGISQLGYEEAVAVAEAMVAGMERARNILESDIEHLNKQLHQAEVKSAAK